MINRFLFILALSLGACTSLWAQLDNRTFIYSIAPDSAHAKGLYLSFESLGFTKNNEYFNRIADGYTLFGFQTLPSLSFYPTEFIKVQAGVYLQRDFGALGYQEVMPTFQIQLKQGDIRYIFGNLEGALNHQLIEPLYDFERIMYDRQETGLQALIEKEKFWLDAWVNWETMLYRGDSAQEEVSGGLSMRYDLIEKGKWKLSTPVQFKVYHQGGQIDRSEAPLTTLWNHALGLEAEYTLSEEKFFRKLQFSNYWVAYKDFSFEFQRPFTAGNAYYANLNLHTHKFDLMLSYWKGQDFLSYKGGLLYQSESTSFKRAPYLSPNRDLLIIRFIQNFEITPELGISLRIEPLIDLQTGKFEFSHGAYFTYRTDFLLHRKP